MGLLELGADEVADLFAIYWLAGHTDHHGFITTPISFRDRAPVS